MYTALLEGEGQGNFGFLITMALVFGVMYFFMIRPQNKKRKKQEEEGKNLKKGDRIVTIGGIHGKIYEIDEQTVVITVEDGAKLRLDKSAVSLDGTVQSEDEKK
jgi:preprotein translocase subunit YajC